MPENAFCDSGSSPTRGCSNRGTGKSGASVQGMSWQKETKMKSVARDAGLISENVENPSCESGSSPPTASLARPAVNAAAEVLTSKEVAAILGRNHKTIERYAREGAIPAHFRLNRWFFLQSELDVWLKADVDSACQPCRVN